MQDFFALAAVGVAALYLVYKLVLGPHLAARRPDVPTSRLVRRSKDAAAGDAE